MDTLRHRIAHWFGWQACRNDCVTINGQLHHFVYCATCGQVAFYFAVPQVPLTPYR